MKQLIKKTIFFKIIKKQQLLWLAKYLSRQKEYKASSLIYSKVLNKTSPAEDLYRYATALNKSGEYRKCLKILKNILGRQNHNKSAQLMVQTLLSDKQPQAAEKFLRQYIESSSAHGGLYYLLGTILLRQKRWWQAEEAFSNAEGLGYDTAKFYFKFAKSAFEMRHYDKAVKLYDKATRKWDDSITLASLSEVYYRAGLSAETGGDTELADEYYQESIKNSLGSSNQDFVIAEFHEKYNQIEKAENMYNSMLSRGTNYKTEVLKKLSAILIKQEKYDDATNLLAEFININATDADVYEMLADINWHVNNYKTAGDFYWEAISRCDYPDAKLINKYLKSLLKIGDSALALQTINLFDCLADKTNFDNLDQTQISNIYTYLYENLDIKDNIIMYESMHGRDFTCNPYAIFKYILNDVKFKNYKHVIVVNDKDNLESKLLSNKNIILVKKDSFLYCIYLASAKYLINNTSFPSYFIRKPNQKYLNTWHGTPWKHLGTDLKDSYKTIGNIQRNLLLSTHIISQNQHTTSVLTDKYDIADIYSGLVAETGYPRNDITLSMPDGEKTKIKSNLGLDHKKKVIFYAPTWRGDDVAKAEDETETIAQVLLGLEKLNCEVIFRGHYFADENDPNKIISNHTVDAKFKTNELLAITDILITDYSSVLFDFIPTKKPIIKYLYDYKQYQKKRGLYFDLNETPGDSEFEINKLIKRVNGYLDGEEYKGSKNDNIFNRHEDGHVTKRVVDFFFKDNKEQVVKVGNRNKNILIYAGSFAPNGITSSAINLMRSIDKTKYNVYLLIDKKGIEHQPNNEELFKSIDKNIRVLSISGKINKTNGSSEIFSDKIITHLSNPQDFSHIYDREFDRIFGIDTKFDYVIDYDGYTRSSVWLFSCDRMKSNSKTNSIYIHSMIYDEYLNKYSYLDQVFKQYNKFDKIVSVSRPAMEKNRSDLADIYEIDKNKFIYIDNVQNPEKVIKLSQEPVVDKNELKIMNDGRTTFINIGRLSIEKGQAKLIRAFHLVYETNKNTKLILIGDGPNAKRLKDMTKKLGLTNAVYFLGYKSNPFKYLKLADCFVLASDYEGQGMVIYESLTLAKPVISTDNGVSETILQNGKYGIVCQPNERSISEAMISFINRGADDKFSTFDIEQYNKQALEMLYNKVIS